MASPSAPPPPGLVPIGALGSVEFTLATLPLISNQYIELDINVSARPGPARRRPGVWWGAGGGRVGDAGSKRGGRAAPSPPVQPIVKSVAGDVIDFPKPPKPVKVPPKEDHTSQVVVPLYLFNTVFGLLQTNGALDLDITPELVSVAPCAAAA